MYDAGLTYEENYQKGPFSHLCAGNKFPKIHYTGKPKFQFLGIPLFIPFGVPAGPLLNAKFMKIAFEAGFCLPTYKTVRSQFHPSNHWPNILKINSSVKFLPALSENSVTASYFEEKTYQEKNISISNSFGVPSQNFNIWQDDFFQLENYSHWNGYHCVLSFQGTRATNCSENELFDNFIEDACLACEQASSTIHKTGFKFLEINLSCPNEKHLPLFRDIPATVKLLKKIKEQINKFHNIKLIAKVGFLKQEDVYKILSEAGDCLDAVSAINTISAEILSNSKEPILGNRTSNGGICGELIREEGLRMASYLSTARIKLGLTPNQMGIIGVGGVSRPEHVQAYLDAGADVVQAATGMMWNLNLAKEVAEYLNVSFIEEN